jgi:hypothetical protein
MLSLREAVQGDGHHILLVRRLSLTGAEVGLPVTNVEFCRSAKWIVLQGSENKLVV